MHQKPNKQRPKDQVKQAFNSEYKDIMTENEDIHTYPRTKANVAKALSLYKDNFKCCNLNAAAMRFCIKELKLFKLHCSDALIPECNRLIKLAENHIVNTCKEEL